MLVAALPRHAVVSSMLRQCHCVPLCWVKVKDNVKSTDFASSQSSDLHHSASLRHTCARRGAYSPCPRASTSHRVVLPCAQVVIQRRCAVCSKVASARLLISRPMSPYYVSMRDHRATLAGLCEDNLVCYCSNDSYVYNINVIIGVHDQQVCTI